MKTRQKRAIGSFATHLAAAFILCRTVAPAQLQSIRIQMDEVSALPLAPADAVSQGGTWWLLSDPNSPPFPCFPPGLASVTNEVPVPVYLLSSNGSQSVYLVDDRAAVAVETLLEAAQRESGLMQTMDSGPPVLGEGEEGGDGGTNQPQFEVTWPSNTLYMTIVGNSNGVTSVLVTLHGLQASNVYELMSATALGSTGTAWTVEATVHSLTGQDWATTTVPMLDRTNALFLWARNWTTNDDNANGLPDWWEWENFGNFNQTAGGDYDGDGINNGMEYTNGSDPNKIRFSIAVTNQYVNFNSVPVQLVVMGGVPSSLAVLVDGTNFAAANWTGYTSNLNVNLGAVDGWHKVWVGLRGRAANSEQTWRSARLMLDTVPPTIQITNPPATVTSRPIVQLQGYSTEPLSSISFDLVNAGGAVSNKLGYTTGQFFATNQWAYTTNWFQCFDIVLTNGLNTITLRAADLAGNVTATNLIYTLDLSGDTNPPVVTLIWPQDGAFIGGTSLTVRGILDDETARATAQIVDTNGVTNIVEGLVERNGQFWIEGLPLCDGSNSLTLTAADAAGNSTVTNLSVVKSDVILVINPVSEEQVNQRTVTVSGTVSDASFSVWVNGIQASVDGNGNWTATNVPTYGAGTATFDAAAYSTGGGGSPPVNQSLAVDKPPALFVGDYSDAWSNSEGSQNWTQSWGASKNYRATIDCTGRFSYEGTGTFFYHVGEGYGWWDTTYNWSDADPTGTYTKTGYDPDSSFPVDGSGSGCGDIWNPDPYSVPSVSYANMRHYFAIISHDWDWPTYGEHQSYTRSSRTHLTLSTGGKAGLTRQSLFKISGWAWEYGRPGGITWYNAPDCWINTPTTDTDVERIQAFGRSLGADGNLFVALPEGAVIGAAASAPGPHNSLNLDPAKYRPRIFWVPTGADITDKTTSAAVGEKISLSCELKSADGYTTMEITNCQWTIPGFAISNYVADANTGKVYTTFATTNAGVSYYWVDGGTKQVQCTVKVAGQELSASTVFNVIRPSSDWIGTIMNTVAVNTNYAYNLSHPPPQVWLHFGGSLLGEQGWVSGIYFTPTNLNLNGYSGSDDFFCVQLLDEIVEHCRTNGTSTHLGGNGLDTDYPYEDFGQDLGRIQVAHDSPATNCRGEDYHVSDSGQYQTFLMFQPGEPSSIPVPLRVIKWSWSGSADADTNHQWSLTTSNATISVNNQDTITFPTWTNNVMNAAVITNNICQ